MRKYIKICSLPILGLSLLICLSLLSVAASAAVDSSRSFEFKLTANGACSAVVSAGEEVCLEVELRRTDEGRNGSYTMYSMQDEIIFDSSYFSLVKGSVDVAPFYDFNVRTMEDGVRKRIILSRVILNPAGAPTPDCLVIATFRLKVLGPVEDGSIASGNYRVNTKNGDTYITAGNDVSVTAVPYDLTFIGNDDFNSLPAGFKLLMLTVASKVEGHAWKYGGETMYYSPSYSDPAGNGHVYLFAVGNDVTETDARENIQVKTGSCLELCYDQDVNADGSVNSTDAVLIYGLYKGVHEADPLFKRVSMQMRLEADVNGDRTVNTGDATVALSRPRD